MSLIEIVRVFSIVECPIAFIFICYRYREECSNVIFIFAVWILFTNFLGMLRRDFVRVWWYCWICVSILCRIVFFSKFFLSFFRLGGWPQLIGNSDALNFSFSLELFPNKGQFKASTVLNLVAWATCFIFEFFWCYFGFACLGNILILEILCILNT